MELDRWTRIKQNMRNHFEEVEEEKERLKVENSTYKLELSEAGLLKAEMPKHHTQGHVEEVFFEDDEVIFEGEKFRYEFRI
jgi:hypothetical protein